MKNQELETLFADFTVNNKKIPFEFLDYEGTEETYIVYNSLGEEPVFFGDDEVLATVSTYDIHIYTKGNYLDILKEVKKKLYNADWTWDEDSEDLYEKDTRFFHKVTTWQKERMITDGQNWI